jgi:hypothetical protein
MAVKAASAPLTFCAAAPTDATASALRREPPHTLCPLKCFGRDPLNAQLLTQVG